MPALSGSPSAVERWKQLKANDAWPSTGIEAATRASLEVADRNEETLQALLAEVKALRSEMNSFAVALALSLKEKGVVDQ